MTKLESELIKQHNEAKRNEYIREAPDEESPKSDTIMDLSSLGVTSVLTNRRKRKDRKRSGPTSGTTSSQNSGIIYDGYSSKQLQAYYGSSVDEENGGSDVIDPEALRPYPYSMATKS